MEAERIFDYVEDSRPRVGLNICLVFEETKSEDIDNDYIPDSFENDSNLKRIATYIDWYTEAAWLFIEEIGIGFERMKEIFNTLSNEKLNPYEFEEIKRRNQNDIKIVELQEGFKVIDKKGERYFTTQSSNNPQQLKSDKKEDNQKE